MLSEAEQRVWDDVVDRFRTEEAAEPPRRPVRGRLADLPTSVRVGCWAAVLLLLFGAAPPAAAVAVATAAGWALWRWWPRLGELGSATSWPFSGAAPPRPGPR
ncbi:hypothetical protein [Blastococcus sp. SYSU D00820]